MASSPPAFGRGRGASHSYVYSPYGRGRGQGRGAVSLPPKPQQPKTDVPHPRFTIDGVTFELVKNGSKLHRITPLDDSLPTPLKHEIAGIKFYRTKGGNLLRHKEYLQLEEKQLARRTLCPKFTRTGHCSRDCRFNHDPSKVAVCKTFLHKRSCPAGSSCPLSHDLTPHRTPVCMFFARGNCTNDNCQYVHSMPKDGAIVCEAFARLGYCEAGENCPHLHVFECPDYANTGKCDKEDCHLPHVQRASQLRRLAGRGSSHGPSSNEHSDNDDLGPEATATFVGADAEASTAGFTQQADYIRI
ncbi:uncharacterized protein PV09_07558 [Verruconis gallopava]|uniref:C3H1-type domain-containing protein n=1 Tax=Verruconis gallopava TaxID=253628 RepID=A0A0D2API5_9PEZI|nr:uncharacterized protein PV09_07558 [Verruconis gallopava]KIW01044.1 hypothetical protein PV09_07558 [Verruconis gallopava]